MKLKFEQEANKVKGSSLLEVVFENQEGSNALYAFRDGWKNSDIDYQVVRHSLSTANGLFKLRDHARDRNCQSWTVRDGYWGV